MAGRSVRWTCTEKRAAAAMPTRPVPAPSSRILGARLEESRPLSCMIFLLGEFRDGR